MIAGLEEDRFTFWLPRQFGTAIGHCLFPTVRKHATIRHYSIPTLFHDFHFWAFRRIPNYCSLIHTLTNPSPEEQPLSLEGRLRHEHQHHTRHTSLNCPGRRNESSPSRKSGFFLNDCQGRWEWMAVFCRLAVRRGETAMAFRTVMN